MRFFGIILILIISMFSGYCGNLYADNYGFQYSWNLNGSMGVNDGNLDFSMMFDADITYVVHNQWAFGAGFGYQNLIFNDNYSEKFIIPALGDEEKNRNDTEFEDYYMRIKQFKRSSVPYYLTIKYNFDINETGYLYTAFKYGYYLPLLQTTYTRDFTDSNREDDDLSYRYHVNTPMLLGVNIGYLFSDNLLISFDFRYVRFKEDITYIDHTNNYQTTKKYTKGNTYFGISVGKVVELF